MFATNAVLLSNLLSQVESAQLKLPDFQRGWIWDDDRIKGLLASISRGFPIGAVLTLEAGGDMDLKSRPVEGVADSGNTPSSYLLDGQQRLTSLYQALIHPDAVDTSDGKNRRIKRRYYIDMVKALDPSIEREDAIVSVPENRIIAQQFGRKEVLNLSTRDAEFANHMMPTESLMNPMTWLLGYVTFWSQDGREFPHQGAGPEFSERFNLSVIDNFSKYQLPVISLAKNTPKEAVCLVFEKVNTGGVSLNVFELATASFAMEGDFSLRNDWAERRHRLHNKNAVLQDVDGDRFLQVMALLKTQNDRRNAESAGRPTNELPAIGCRKRDILDLKLSDYKHWADKVEEGFLRAGEFLNQQFIVGKKNVPYPSQLVPLTALFVELGNEAQTGNAIERLKRWYWTSVFGEVYGGPTETLSAQDLVRVAGYVRTGTEPQTMGETTFLPERLLSLRSRVSAAYKGVYALQMKSDARDWITTQKLAIPLIHDRNIDIHHIFPEAWCKKNKIDGRIYNSVINKTPMDALTNRRIGGRAPSEYLATIRKNISSEEAAASDASQESLNRLLQSHKVALLHLEEDSFSDFFIERGQELLQLIGEAMGRNLGDGRAVFRGALEDAGLLDDYLDEPEELDEMVGGDEFDEPDAA